MDDVLILISQSKTQDENGVWQITTTSREVFCKVSSVTRAEFFSGGRNGLNPEYRFSVFVDEYEGESICEYRGNTYAIYRTYRWTGSSGITRDYSSMTPDYIELYAQREGGTNGKAESNTD